MSGTIYICHDIYSDRELNQAAAALDEAGWAVLRGPAIVPGRRHEFTPEERQRLLAPCDVIVVNSRTRLFEEDIAAAPKLRAVVFPTIGTDAVDIQVCSRRGILVANGAIPENFLSMAESTVMLMLVLLYDLHRTEAVLREGLARPKQMRSRMLRGRTVGLVGLGRIGMGVAQRLAGWEAEILVHDPYIAPASVPSGFGLVELDDLLAGADVVSLHVPLNETTRHLIGERELRLMRKDAILLNTARGGLIDESALARVMGEGHLAGAGLDVTEIEPLPAESPLRQLDRVVLTPHMLGHTIDCYEAIAPALLKNIDEVMRGELPANTCDHGIASAWKARLASLGA